MNNCYGYFLCADILGFASIVRNLDSQELKKRISAWTKMAGDLIGEFEMEKNYSLISDTLFVYTEGTNKELIKLLSFCNKLLETSIKCYLPIRGGVSLGDYFVLNNTPYGKAVVRAHNLEQKQNWIGIALDESVKSESEEFSKLTICYPVPFKNGAITLCNVVKWSVPSFDELVRSSTSGGLYRGGESLSWEWMRKIVNTLEFGIYSHMLKTMQKNSNEFHGFHSLQAIDMNLRKHLYPNEE
jgi:hypothetical protein